MSDAGENIRKAACMGAFLCLAFSLSQWAARGYEARGTITSQKSLLILLALSGACAWAGRRFFHTISALDGADRDLILASAFVYMAGALNVVLFPWSGPNVFYLAPFILYGVLRMFPALLPPDDERLERLLTVLGQAAALSLLIPLNAPWGISFLLGLGLTLAFHRAMFQITGETGYALERLALFSPVMACWFCAGLSNQLVNILPAASPWILAAGFAAVPVLVWILKKRPGQTPFINRCCLGLFAASMLVDVNLGAVLATPLRLFDFHWWVHVAPGLEPMHSVMKPFVHYVPIEGLAWAAWMPHLWFAVLNQTTAGYLLLFAALSLLGQALFIALTAALLKKAWGMTGLSAAAAASALGIANLAVLQVCYPAPGGWSIAERAPWFFICCLGMVFYWFNRERISSSQKGAWLAFGLGAAHVLGFFMETLLGAGAIVGLLGAMALAPGAFKRKRMILLGGVSALAVMLAVIRPPLHGFFISQPLTLVSEGLKQVDASGAVNIFAIFDRSRILSTLHYSFPLAVFALFLGLLPFSVRRHPLFGLALHFFLASLFLFLTGGQRHFGAPEGACSTVLFAALSSVLSIPLLICLLAMAMEGPLGRRIPRGAMVKIGLCVFVVVVCADGWIMGKAPGPVKVQMSGKDYDATNWEEQVHYLTAYTFGLPAVLGYHHRFKNRSAVKAGPEPLAIHFKPYGEWKNDPGIQVPIHRTIGYFQEQEYVP